MSDSDDGYCNNTECYIGIGGDAIVGDPSLTSTFGILKKGIDKLRPWACTCASVLDLDKVKAKLDDPCCVSTGGRCHAGGFLKLISPGYSQRQGMWCNVQY